MKPKKKKKKYTYKSILKGIQSSLVCKDNSYLR